ncbi:hypothetical protein SAMN02983003_1577 [Devosia enhydra]|uniref:Uncharacterized protein n=1 Tax=Devosia enhydra TaxID=665118 RepID=A0A1K2HWE3_9HYPH|nr:hypothetical protein [Devosia enhydra]SFZ83317.1 hypothetical protein SAMN02983003_1577 [Devosia enhydra]
MLGVIALLCAVTPMPQALAQTSAQPQLLQMTPLGQAAAQRGVRTCLANVDAFARDLGDRYDIGVYIFNKLEQADRNLFSLSLELSPSPSGDAFYMSASFAPAVDGQCHVMLESTIIWRSSCAAVGLAYPGFQPGNPLLRDIQSFATTGAERLFLMPSGPDGCISIEKNLYFSAVPSQSRNTAPLNR